MKKIAVTGGIASGKSSVCEKFRELGAFIVNADEISHQLLSPNTDLGKKIVSLLGSDIVTNNQFDRHLIAQKVFSNYSLLEKLENLLHPEVQKEIIECYERLLKSPLVKQNSLFIAEIPLLFESRSEVFFNIKIAVVAPFEDCLKRFTQKTGLSEEEYIKRSNRLLSDEERIQKADQVIVNDRTLEKLYKEVERLYLALINTNGPTSI